MTETIAVLGDPTQIRHMAATLAPTLGEGERILMLSRPGDLYTYHIDRLYTYTPLSQGLEAHLIAQGTLLIYVTTGDDHDQ